MPLGDGSSLSAAQGNILVSRPAGLQGFDDVCIHTHALLECNFLTLAGQDGFGLPFAAGKRRSICTGATSDEFTLPASAFSSIMQTGSGGPLSAH